MRWRTSHRAGVLAVSLLAAATGAATAETCAELRATAQDRVDQYQTGQRLLQRLEPLLSAKIRAANAGLEDLSREKCLWLDPDFADSTFDQVSYVLVLAALRAGSAHSMACAGLVALHHADFQGYLDTRREFQQLVRHMSTLTGELDALVDRAASEKCFGTGATPAAPTAAAPTPARPSAVPPSGNYRSGGSEDGRMQIACTAAGATGPGKCSGSYRGSGDNKPAKIEGTLDTDNVLTGYWAEAESGRDCVKAGAGQQLGSAFWGRLRFQVAADGNGWTGMWGYCADAPGQGNWNGTR